MCVDTSAHTLGHWSFGARLGWKNWRKRLIVWTRAALPARSSRLPKRGDWTSFAQQPRFARSPPRSSILINVSINYAPRPSVTALKATLFLFGLLLPFFFVPRSYPYDVNTTHTAWWEPVYLYLITVVFPGCLFVQWFAFVSFVRCIAGRSSSTTVRHRYFNSSHYCVFYFLSSSLYPLCFMSFRIFDDVLYVLGTYSSREGLSETF